VSAHDEVVLSVDGHLSLHPDRYERPALTINRKQGGAPNRRSTGLEIIAVFGDAFAVIVGLSSHSCPLHQQGASRNHDHWRML